MDYGLLAEVECDLKLLLDQRDVLSLDVLFIFQSVLCELSDFTIAYLIVVLFLQFLTYKIKELVFSALAAGSLSSTIARKVN